MAHAQMLETGFITESHRVRDALREALAAAAEAVEELQWSYELQQQGSQDVAVIARRAHQRRVLR